MMKPATAFGALLILMCFSSQVIRTSSTVGADTATSEDQHRCPTDKYKRLANSCYFLSDTKAPWQEAHFQCREQEAQLAILATEFEYTSVRDFLATESSQAFRRWIGGMSTNGRWVWAAQGTEIDLHDQLVHPLNDTDTDEWLCLYMDPGHRYRWSYENCMQPLHFICEAHLVAASSNSSSAPKVD